MIFRLSELAARIEELAQQEEEEEMPEVRMKDYNYDNIKFKFMASIN